MKYNMTSMIRFVLLATMTGLATLSHAELTALDDNALSKTNGQNGIFLDTEMQLNRSQKADGSVGDQITCAKGGTDCEFAMRYDGNDKWLVIYDFSGGLKIENLKYSASTVDDGTAAGRPALAIGDTTGTTTATATFDNYGASSWAFTGDQGVVPGYRAAVPMGADGTLDEGKPQGFWDLRIDGTLSMTGGLKLYNCSGMGVAGC